MNKKLEKVRKCRMFSFRFSLLPCDHAGLDRFLSFLFFSFYIVTSLISRVLIGSVYVCYLPAGRILLMVWILVTRHGGHVGVQNNAVKYLLLCKT